MRSRAADVLRPPHFYPEDGTMSLFSRLAARLRGYERTHNFTCDVCGREVFAGEHVCDSCRAALPAIGRHCPVCGRRVREEGVCAACKQRRPVAGKVRSCFSHEGEAARLVLRFKRGERYLACTLAEWMLPLLAAFPGTDALVPVPMTKRAKRRRGFDQTLLLARELSEWSGVPVLCAAEKRRDTPPQKSLSRSERAKNLEGCFRVADRAAVRGKTLLIVDDTYTTGATADELAAVLLRAGAKEVNALTFTSVEDKAPFGRK